MANMKIRQKQESKTPIKTVDRKAMYIQKVKENIVNIKDKVNYNMQDNENESQYGADRITENTKRITNKGMNSFNRYGGKCFKKTKLDVQKGTQKIKKNMAKKATKVANKTAQNTIKNTKNAIKTVQQTEKVAYKTAKATAKVTAKSAKKSYQVAKATAKATVQGIKVTIKATIATVKAIIVGIKALASAIIAGGGVAVIIIVVLCTIGLLFYSFSGENSSNIVMVAMGEVGNVGGEPYWRWYGFRSRVEWCACFVSWCANQCNYIEKDIIPKFANCMQGASWFKEKGQWKEKDNMVMPGDIIFFDWEGDGVIDHVGIVEKIEKTSIYTIEGNSNDRCKQNVYEMDSNYIFGYGVPMYHEKDTEEK